MPDALSIHAILHVHLETCTIDTCMQIGESHAWGSEQEGVSGRTTIHAINSRCHMYQIWWVPCICVAYMRVFKVDLASQTYLLPGTRYGNADACLRDDRMGMAKLGWGWLCHWCPGIVPVNPLSFSLLPFTLSPPWPPTTCVSALRDKVGPYYS